MLKEARHLSSIHKNIVVKIPLTAAGLSAVSELKKEGIKTNVTLCFSPNQALLAAKSGATYISPFVGRLDDVAHEGLEIVEQILDIYRNYDFDTKVLVASVRHPLHVLESALMGAHVATIPYKVLMSLVRHPLTDVGIERFLKDWENVPSGS
jgi:transaldolase